MIKSLLTFLVTLYGFAFTALSFPMGILEDKVVPRTDYPKERIIQYRLDKFYQLPPETDRTAYDKLVDNAKCYNYFTVDGLYVYYIKDRLTYHSWENDLWWDFTDVWVLADPQQQQICFFYIYLSPNKILARQNVMADVSSFGGPLHISKYTDENVYSQETNGVWTFGRKDWLSKDGEKEFKGNLYALGKKDYYIRIHEYARSRTWDYQKDYTPEKLAGIFEKIIDVLQSDTPPPSAKKDIDAFIEKFNKLKILSDQRKEKEEKKRLLMRDREWNYFPSGKAYKMIHNKEGADLAKILVLPEGNDTAVWPNVNKGRCVESWFQQKYGDKYSNWAYPHEQQHADNDSSIACRLSITAAPGKAAAPPHDVTCIVVHFNSQRQARNVLAQMRYSVTTGDSNLNFIAKNTRVKPGLVGDYDLALKPMLDANGAIIPRSEESALFFTRGNTAVMLHSSNEGYSVLPIARAIDAELKRGIEEANKSGKQQAITPQKP